MNKLLLILSILIFSFSLVYAQEVIENNTNTEEIEVTELNPDIDAKTQELIGNSIRAFEKNDTYKNFSIMDNNTYYEVALDNSDLFWELTKNFEVYSYKNWTDIEKRMNIHVENATLKREDLLKNAVEYLNSKGISLINHNYNKEDEYFDDGCYEYYFQCNYNDQKEGLTDAQYIKVSVGCQDGKIYEFIKDLRPILYIVDKNVTDDNKLLDTTKSFLPNWKKDKIEISLSSPMYSENTNKLIYSIFAMGEENSNFMAEFEFDAYNGALYSASTSEESPKFSQETLAKIEAYKKSIPVKEQPALGKIEYSNDVKAIVPTQEAIDLILVNDTKVAENTSYDLSKFTKLFDNIYSIKINDKNYIFKNNSSWCLVGNIPTKMSGIFTVNDKGANVPADFAKM